MPEELTCEYRLKPGTKWEVPCGEPAGAYKVTSAFTIQMNLCDYHRNYLIAVYDWTVVKIKDREETCQQDTTKQSSN